MVLSSTPEAAMNQDMFGNRSDSNMSKELEYFDRILKQHSCNEAKTFRQQADSSQLCMGAGVSSTTDAVKQIPKHNMDRNPLLDKLCNKKVNLVLVATSLDEGEVVKMLKSTLDPEKSSMIPLKFDNDGGQSSSEYRNESCESRKKSKEGKDERYWKRRTNNNEAAKKSRDGRKARFEWIEKRIKELEVENASLREQLDSLTQEVLENEKKKGLEKSISGSS